MDLFEKFNRSFGAWYEGLFGGGDDVRPKDILRRILAAMEDHRKEGFDNKIYVPNQYVLEINVHDEEEKEYLLSFLDREELDAAIRRYCRQNRYHIRGALDFTIKEVENEKEGEEPAGKRGEKVSVRCRYNTRITAPEGSAVGHRAEGSAVGHRAEERIPIEDRTQPSFGVSSEADESGTQPAVPSAALVVYAPNRPPYRHEIARALLQIGRSPHANNDLVIDNDGQISKRHARIEWEGEGQFVLHDAGSTNGTKVNGRRVDRRVLHDGDEILLGGTRLTFQLSSGRSPGLAAALLADFEEGDRTVASLADRADARSAASPRPQGAFGGAAAALNPDTGSSGPMPPMRALRSRAAVLVLLNGGQEVDDYLLASETLIGRGVTNDVVLPDRSISMRHARIVNDGDGYTLERLDPYGETLLNGEELPANRPHALCHDDLLTLGVLCLRFENGVGK